MKFASISRGAGLLLLSAAAIAGFGSNGSGSNQPSNRTWITNVTIISPENLDHIEKGSVLIESGRIVSVARKTGTKKPAGATVVDGKGQFLIPGLIDSHVHLASVPGMSFDQTESKPGGDQGIFQATAAFLPVLRIHDPCGFGRGRSESIGRLQTCPAASGFV